jgi:class 3 adenylate cyclase
MEVGVTELADQSLDEARQAFDRHAWRLAYERLAAADSESALGAEDLERMAEAAWWIGRLTDVITAIERAFTGYLAAGQRSDAARAALRLAAEFGHKKEPSVAAGWRRRAERLLANEPESIAHALLSRARFNDALAHADYAVALEHARQTYSIAERHRATDLLAMALHDQGQALIAQGDVTEGLGLIDEATVAAVGGELGPYATAVVYCNTIEACKNLADYGRAGEWTEAARRWCERQSIAGFPGMCRVGRAEIFRLRGAWPEAEEQATLAAVELRDFYLDYAGEGFYQLGEIRVRMGDLVGATDYFGQAAELGRDPQPGLALVRLAEGRPEAATMMLREALDEQAENRLGRARLLPALVDAAVSVGDLETARSASTELAAIADTYRTSALEAAAALAAASVSLAAGQAPLAVAEARRSRRLWQTLDFPYELARARVVLGDAIEALGDSDAAARELEAALAIFERLGAAADAGSLRVRLGRPDIAAIPIVHAQVTFMFTDVVGSTQLIEVIGDEAWENLLRWHDRVFREIFAAHGGDVVKHTGDGFLVAFPSADAGLAAGQAVQRALERHRREHGFAPQVRIGLHSSDAVRHEGDFSGAGVHIAARVAALADAGEILVTSDTLAVAAPVDVLDRRTVALKGVSAEIEVARVGWRPAAANQERGTAAG